MSECGIDRELWLFGSNRSLPPWFRYTHKLLWALNRRVGLNGYLWDLRGLTTKKEAPVE